jgi:DNA-binding phage protein
MWAMNTREQLAEALRGVNVAKLARHTGIAEKTIYRLRNGANDPTLGTAERLIAGAAEIKQVPKPAPVDQQAAA